MVAKVNDRVVVGKRSPFYSLEPYFVNRPLYSLIYSVILVRRMVGE